MFDCIDGSDEGNCEPLQIDEKSYRKILPPVRKGKHTNILFNLDIHSITSIDELEMKFTSEVTALLQWKDPRITYKVSGSQYSTNICKMRAWTVFLCFSLSLSNLNFN